MTSIELASVQQGFRDLHEGRPVGEDCLLQVKDLLTAGYYFPNYMISDFDRNNVYSSSSVTIHAAFNQMLYNIVKLGCESMHGPIIEVEEPKTTEE